MASTRRPLPGRDGRSGERGAVLVMVLVVLVLFVLMGGFATLYVSNMQNSVVQRERSMRALYAAEAAVNAMATEVMTDTGAHPGIKLDDVTSMAIDASTASDAVIELGPSAGGSFDYRVWARGYSGKVPGPGRVQRYVRAYLRFDANSGSRHVQLIDSEEVRENVVSERAHREVPKGSGGAPDPAVDRIGSVLHRWLPEDHKHLMTPEGVASVL